MGRGAVRLGLAALLMAGLPGLPALAAHSSGCPAGACITIDATKAEGAVTHVGAGLLHGVQAGANLDVLDVRQLGTTMYRGVPNPTGNGSYDWNDWDVATASGAQTTLVLSDLWRATTGPGYPPTPWSNWAAYAAWVKATVRGILASGHTVTYWEVQNEPGLYVQYSPAQFRTVTRADVLEQFLVAYRAIKSVDPSASVVGPSTAELALRPFAPNSITHEPDLGTFLRFAVAHHIHLAAVEWHDTAAQPQTIESEVIRAETFIRTMPALGHPLIYVNEYGAPWNQTMPGFDVGFLAALSDSGANLANRACYNTSCWSPDLDGLLTPNGAGTTSDYQVRLTYAQMNGRLARTTSTAATVPALASINSTNDQVVGLIGRDAGCAIPVWCQTVWGGRHPVGPTSVRVRVAVPWASATRITLSYEAFQPGATVTNATPAIPADMSIVPYGSGRQLVSFTIPSFTDGSAYNLVISPDTTLP